MKCASSVACEISDTFLIYRRKALFTLILTVQQSSNWKLFFCFPEDGAITQGFGLFYWTDSPCYTLSLSTSSAREVAPATTTIPASGSVGLGCEAPLACSSFSSASKLISILFWWLAEFSRQVGCTSTISLSPMSAQFCTLQITFFLLVASGGGQASGCGSTSSSEVLSTSYLLLTGGKVAFPGVLVYCAEALLMGYGCLVSCESKRREKGNDSCHHYVHISPQKLCFK